MEEYLMRMLKVLCCAAAMSAMTAPLATAQQYEWTKKTFLTFSGPVQVPGKTLAAGTYTFQVADLLSNRHVVQIMDKDGKERIAQFMTMEARTTSTPEKNVVMFNERPVGASPAVKIWYYPGNQYGNEFVYPRTQAIQIAKESHTPVLATKDEDTSDSAMKSGEVAYVDENGNNVKPNDTPSTTIAQNNTASEPAPAPAPASVGTSGQTPAPAANAAPARRRTLPRTGSNLVLFELLSGLALGGYFGARKVRKGLEGA
jgi:hypothetical protein